jgi:cell division protein FtsA
VADKLLLAVGLDAGSTHTRCVICLLEGDRLRLLGHGHTLSQGWSRSRLADHNAISDSMRAALREAEQMCGLSVGAVVLGIGGATVSGHNSRGVYEFGYQREITPADLRRAVERAARVVLPDDRMILHRLPQDFAVDGSAGHRNPCGMKASKLEAFVHLVMVSLQEHDELIGAANRAHVEVEDTLFEPLAAAYAAVLPRDRREGLTVLDIGAQSTELAVYYGEALVHSASIPICGDHFTWDVARGLRMSCEEAEAVKQQYGCAVLDFTAANSVIVLPGAKNGGPRERPRRDLNLILEARAKELFGWVLRELARVSMDQNLLGVVLSGGAARLAGMCDLAERTLNCQARNGLPAGIQDWPRELDTPEWTTAAGLAMYSARKKHRTGRDRGGNGFFSGLWR